MSSHHIVRDEQEPALILIETRDFSEEILGQLLEWSPIVICCDTAVDRALAGEIKLDIAIVPSVKQELYRKKLSVQAPVKIISMDNPDYLLTAMQLLQKEGHTAVNIVTDASGIQSVLDEVAAYHAMFDIVIYDGLKKHVLISRADYSKWLASNSEIRLSALGNQGDLRTEGFAEDYAGRFDRELHLQKVDEGQVKISSSAVPFLVSEKIL